MNAEFPKLPSGYRWVVKYERSSYGRSFDKIEARIKDRLFTRAAGSSYLSVVQDPRMCAEFAAKRAYAEFRRNRKLDSISLTVCEYEAWLNEEAHK